MAGNGYQEAPAYNSIATKYNHTTAIDGGEMDAQGNAAELSGRPVMEMEGRR